MKSAVVRSMKGITRSLLTKQRFSKNGPEEDCILTEGVNLNAAWNFSEIIDAKRIYTNDIGAVLRTYGVEAARSAIVREISNVFGVYGISVDNRHLVSYPGPCMVCCRGPFTLEYAWLCFCLGLDVAGTGPHC